MGCFSGSSNFDNDLDSQSLILNNEAVDKILSSTPERNKISLEELEKYFKNNPEISSLDIQDKVLLVFKWITNNISFDCETYMYTFQNRNGMNCLNLEEIYSEGKGISHDFSNLFLNILSAIDSNIETFLIKGYNKNIIYKFGTEIKEQNHEWLAVKINHRWYLVDPTFGAGYFIYKDKILKFIKDYNPFYLFIHPQYLIKTNFPEDELWQLNSKKMKKDNFYKLPIYKSNFFKLGFKSVEPEEGNLIIEKQGKIVISFQKNIDIKNIYLNGKLSYKEKNNSKEEHNAILINKNDDHFEILFYINKNNEYKLTLFAINSISDKNNFKEIVVFKINKNNNKDNNKDGNNIQNQNNFYPTIYDKFLINLE